MARKKELDDQPTPSGNAMLAYVLLRLGRIWGDDELEQRGVGVLRLVRDTLVRVPTAFGWMLVALDQYLAPRREWAIIGPADAPVARAALALRAPTDVVAFGPGGRRAAAGRQDARRRSPRRLRLRAVHLPAAGDRPGRLARLDRADLGVGQRREQLVERRLEDGMRRAGRAPDAVEAAERFVDDRRQVAVVPDRGNAADREAGRGARLVGARGPSVEVLDAAVAGAQHHRRHVVDDEDERLDDLADVAAARRRGLLRRSRRVGQLANLHDEPARRESFRHFCRRTMHALRLPMPMALLSVSNVTRRFGGIVAVDDVSLDVERGQIVGLIGPNGAGKTTLFNIVTRLYRPDSGRLDFDGKSLLRTPPHRVVRRGIARTFQNVELFRSMTVLENVLVGGHTRTRPFSERAARARAQRRSTTWTSRTSPTVRSRDCRSAR